MPIAFLHQLQDALAHSLFWVYILIFVLAAIGLAAMALLPGGRAEQYSYKARTEAATADDAGADEQALKPVVVMD